MVPFKRGTGRDRTEVDVTTTERKWDEGPVRKYRAFSVARGFLISERMSPRSIATNTQVDRTGLEGFIFTMHRVIL